MTQRQNRKKWILYPEDRLKNYWNLFMTLILLIVCVTTPLDIAFSDVNEDNKFGYSNVIDILFLCDMIVIFNSAYYSKDMDIIDDRKTISKSYLTGWFTLDLLAIIPFDLIFSQSSSNSQFNSLVRVARFGRLQKLVKLTRLLRVLKIFKEHNKLQKFLTDFLSIGLGFQRLFFFIMIFLLLLHIVSCLWLIVASLYADEMIINEGKPNERVELNYSGTWLDDFAK